MSSSVISEIRADGVAAVTLNRPEVHNAFDEHLIAELTGIFGELGQDDGVRVVVLAGNGKSFSAGADLNWMRRTAAYSKPENFEDALRLARMMRSLDVLSKPTVAKVHGAAFGGGVGLVACCDIAIAAESAVFSFSEVRLGLLPAAIGPYALAAIGARNARRYFLSGERFSAEEARRIGLVHEVVPAEELDTRVSAVLAELLKGGPQAQRACKAFLADIHGKPLDDRLIHYTSESIATCRASEEGQEGVNAFLEKRLSSW